MVAERPRESVHAERGATLVELIAALVVIAILMAVTVMMYSTAKQSSRNKTMEAAASQVHAAVGMMNRDFPPVQRRDRLLAATAWTGNEMPGQTGLVDRHGRPYLNDWPQNPFSGRDLVVRRGACAPPAVGEILVCRPNGPGTGALRVIATGRARQGAKVVYDRTTGA